MRSSALPRPRRRARRAAGWSDCPCVGRWPRVLTKFAPADLAEPIDCDWPINPDESGIYFEFSYLRDLWYAKGNANDINKALIIELLRKNSFTSTLADGLQKLPTHDFNSKFIQGRISNQFIQSPANWQLPVFLKWLHQQGDIVAVCMLKWAFRAKPDIVVQTDMHHALCLELKLESREGSYPAEGCEKRLLREMGLFDKGHTRPFPISQTAVQQYMMNKLLGLNTRYVFITRSQGQSTPKVNGSDLMNLSWSKLFKAFDKDALPPFMREAIRRAVENTGGDPNGGKSGDPDL